MQCPMGGHGWSWLGTDKASSLESLRCEAIVSHESGCMAEVQNPSKCLSEAVRGIDFAWHMLEDDVTQALPLLHAKVADVNVSRSWRRSVMVDNLDGRFIVLIDRSWCLL